MAEPTLYRGQGIVSIAERSPNGEPLGFTDLGNCPRFEVRSMVKRSEHRENRTGREFIDAIVESGANCQIYMELDSTAGVNLYRLLYGQIEDLPAGVVENEPITLWHGKGSITNHVGLISWLGLRDQSGGLLIQRTPDQPLAWTVVWDGTYFYSNNHGLQTDQIVRLLGVSVLPFTIGQDYYAIPIDSNSFQLTDTPSATVAIGGDRVFINNEPVVIGSGTPIVGGATFSALLLGVYDYTVDLKSGAITLPSTSRLNNGQTTWASYAFASAERLYGFVKPAYPVTLLFRGKNTANNDRPLRVKIHRVKLDPTTAWQLIGQTFQRFEVEGLVLLDDRHPDLFKADFWSSLVVPPPPPAPTYNFANINPEAIDDYAVLIGFANIDPGALDDYAIVPIGFANVNAEAIAL